LRRDAEKRQLEAEEDARGVAKRQRAFEKAAKGMKTKEQDDLNLLGKPKKI